MTTKTLDLSQIKSLFKNPTFVPFLVIWITHGIGGFGITFILPNVICKYTTIVIQLWLATPKTDTKRGLSNEHYLLPCGLRTPENRTSLTKLFP